MELLIEERKEYGTKRTYPMNKLGQDFAERLGKKTLSWGDLDFISTLGVTIKHVPFNNEWS